MKGDAQSHGLWEASAPAPPETSPLRGATPADVIIVGGGYTGLSAALHLAEAGCDAVVLEAEAVGFGGSGRNSGLVNAGLWLTPRDILARLGDDYGERLLARLESAPDLVFSLIEAHGIACEAARVGTLHCARDAAGLREIEDRETQWQARGAPVRVVRGVEVAELTGTQRFAGALLDERAGTIQPLAYARGLAAAALAAGARIHTESPVIGFSRDAGAWRVATPDGHVVAERVLVAVNAYGGPPWPQISAAQIGMYYSHFATPPLEDSLRDEILPQRHGAWDTRKIITSIRFDAAGRLIIGSVGSLQHGGGALLAAWAKREMLHLYPRLAEVSWQHQWQGRFAMTPDHLPHFHELAPGMVTVAGYNGRGIGPGTAFGKMLAEKLLDRPDADLPLPTSPVTPVALRGVKQAVYELGARGCHMLAARK